MTYSARRLGSSIALAFLLAGAASAQSLTIGTLAGPRTGGGYVDAQGSAARFSEPTGVALEPSGSIVVADTGNHVIRRVSPDGVVTTVAGRSGLPGFADGAAAEARFNTPNGVAVDSAGAIYVADTGNHVIRRIAPNGTVTTLAGTPRTSGTADGTGAAARFTFPYGLDVDANNEIIVADTSNHTIRRVTQGGVVTTIAGSARSAGSEDGFGTQAHFYYPTDVAADTNGNIYVADSSNNTIRRITPEGRVTTIAGKAFEDVNDDEPDSAGSVDAVGTAARFQDPWSVDVDTSGTLWVADTGNETIRRITPAFEVTTVAGSAEQPGRTNAVGTNARFYSPSGIAAGVNGFYIADRYNDAVRFMSPTFNVTTLAGSVPEWGSVNGAAASARFFYPTGVAIDGAGNVYVSEYSDTIRKITPAGNVSTLAGLGDAEGSADGTGSNARFDAPQGIAADAQGNVYVADSFNSTIRKVTPAGVVTTIGGFPGEADFRDGSGTESRFDEPNDVAVDSAGNVYVADTFNHRIRIIEPNGLVSTFAGSSFSGSSDGVGTDATFAYPTGVAVDASRNIYVADRYNHIIRKIAQNGTVTTVAGKAGEDGHIDAQGAAARFSYPTWIAATPDGVLYVTEDEKHSIRRIDQAGNVTTSAGLPFTSGNVDGTGTAARFFYPQKLAAGSDGRVYIADLGNHNVRVGTLAAPEVVSFTASPASIEEGGTSTLSWNVSNATSVNISGIGAVTAIGTTVVHPATTTTYTLTAIGPGGTVTRTVTVAVGQPARRRSVRH
jgi:sugar lactone lactonase YvrE